MARLFSAAREHRPDALVVVGFSRLQPASRRAGQEARHPGHLLHQPADLGVARQPARDHSAEWRTSMLVIFPFEEAIYRKAGVPVEFVGHPLVDLARPSAPRHEFLRRARS